MLKSTFGWRAYLMAAVVALGVTVPWALLVVMTLGVTESARHRGQPYEQLLVGRDGAPYILRYTHGLQAPVQEAVTLSGEPAGIETRSLLYPNFISPRARGSSPTAVNESARLAAVNDDGVPAQYWYLAHDDDPAGDAYGVGFDSISKQIVGYFGRKGFTDRLPPRSEWFDVAGNVGLAHSTPNITLVEPQWSEDHILYLLADGKLWAVDPQRREVKAIAGASRDAVVGWAWDFADDAQERPRGSRSAAAWAPRDLLVRSEEDVRLVDPPTGEEIVFPLPAGLRNATFAGARLETGELLLLAYESTMDRLDWKVVWLDPQSGVVREENIRLTQLGGTAGPETVGWYSAAAAPFPLGQCPAVFLLPLAMVENRYADSYFAALGGLLRHFWPALLAVTLVGVVSAVAAYRRQRRFALPSAIGWAVFAFLFGAPGWIAYRWHRSWPVLEECPACHQPAPQDRDRCTECAAPFPPPPMQGIEVFA